MDTCGRMRRYLFIVSARHSGLYRYLSQLFSGDNRVVVIMDRRRGERREGGVWSAPERRRRDRRLRPEVEAEVRARSYAIVILDEPESPVRS